MDPHRFSTSSARGAQTVIAPLGSKQKCLSVMKSPDQASTKLACLNAGVEVSIAGESGDQKWAIL